MPSSALQGLAALAAGLEQVGTWPTPMYLLLGVAIGYVVGVLPGLGAPAALALVLPSVISLQPVDGFVLLTAVAIVSAMAGDVTSILLGVPGEATAAAIVPDGHAMAANGLAGVATGAALTAAWLGAVIGVVVLAALLPVAQPLLATVQSPELAAIAVLGLCLVTPLSGADPMRGLAAAACGLAMATIGLDPVRGEPRLTFGQVGLWDGLGLLSVAMGLYAVPEALAMVRAPAAERAAPSSGHLALREGCIATFKRPGLVLRSGAIGAGIGILPGVGAAVSQWIAYAHASQTSPRSTAFGSGAVEGVIAPAAATTATFGGALAPTLALGIPGSVVTAFFLGALIMKGLAPGPSLLLPEQAGGHLTLVWSLIWAVVLAASLGAAFSALTLDWALTLAGTRPSRLFPFVVMLVILGTLGERHAVFDLGILAAVGLLGCTMAALEWPRAPLILGFVLGPLLERRWLLSQDIYGWSWLLRPGVVVLAALTALLIFFSRPRLGVRPSALRRSPARRLDLALALALALVAAVGLWFMTALTPRSAAFPRLAFGALLAGSLTCAWSIRRQPPGPAVAHTTGRTVYLARLSWLAAFIVSAWLLGVAVGTAVAAAAHSRLEARDTWRTAVMTSGAVGATAYLLLSLVMHFTDEGALVQWLSP